MIKNFFKNTLKNILKLLPLRNVIVFESVPDLSDNTMPVFEELVKRGYNQKYKMVWICFDPLHSDYKKIKNVKYIDRNKSRIIGELLARTCKVIICCNHFLGCVRKDQHSFYLCHGLPLKDVSTYYNAPKTINHIVATSEYMKPLLAEQLKADISVFSVLGFPRNDVLINNRTDLSKYFGSYSKYIVWYPTVKTFKSGKKTGCTQPIQFIHDAGIAKALNEVLKENDILLIVKPHFAQLTSEVKEIQLSNLRFINDEFFKENKITSYEMVGACDALLTDYSSIYCDFLLCNKPIGLIWEDIAQYSKDPGLVPDYEFLCSGGEKIYNYEELCDFIRSVKNGEDRLAEQRRLLLPNIHCSIDPDNTQRVTDYIISNSHLSL